MHDLAFVSLDTIAEKDLIDLMNDPAVGRLLPLLRGRFGVEECRAFQATKRALWEQHGYGPWAFRVNGEFAGWGGLQPERGEADFALILHPRFWGWGRRIFTAVKQRAFDEMKLPFITALLPPGRTNAGAIRRFGFVEDGNVEIEGNTFRRFRLDADPAD